MIRVDVGTKKSSDGIVQQGVPDGIFNGSHFLTYRYGWLQSIHAKRKPGKAFLDLSRVPFADLLVGNTNPHRPVKNHCTKWDAFPTVSRSPFSVYHYAGTMEQFLYRADGRRSRQEYNQRNFLSRHDDSAKFWLEGFVREVGSRMAKILLDGVGVLEPQPKNMSTHVIDFVGSENASLYPLEPAEQNRSKQAVKNLPPGIVFGLL